MRGLHFKGGATNRTFRGFIVVIMLASVISTASPARAHSGGTDKYGCHAGSRAYHCHSGADTADLVKMFQINGLNKKLKFRTALKRYSSCSTLNRVYLRGIAKRSGKSSDLTQFVSKRHYNLNKHLDTNLNGIACGFLESENARISTDNCKTSLEDNGDGTTFETAYRCLMAPQPAEEIGGGWKIELLSRTPDAELAIRSVSLSYSPAPENYQYYVAKIRVTNLSGRTNDFPMRLLGARGESGRKYDYRSEDCDIGWTLLGEKLYDVSLKIPNGASATGNICWLVTVQDAPGLKVTLTTQRYCNCNMYSYIDRVIYIAFE